MVLLKPKQIFDKTAYFKSVGRFVDTFNGRYITAEDSGTSVEDMDIVATETRHVTGISKGTFSIADPSVLTAMGVERGIQAAVDHTFGKTLLKDMHIAIQGLGHVGYQLAKRLHAQGAKLTVYDIRQETVQRCVHEFNATAVSHIDALFTLQCDVLAPSALGAVLNDRTIPMLKASIIAGSANNQLEDPRHGVALMKRGILYAPDYVINAGGLIYVASQYSHLSEEIARLKIDKIYDTLTEIFNRSKAAGMPTSEIADMIAREKLKKV